MDASVNDDVSVSARKRFFSHSSHGSVESDHQSEGTSARQPSLLNEVSTVPVQSAGSHPDKLELSGASLPPYATSRSVSFAILDPAGSFDSAVDSA